MWYKNKKLEYHANVELLKLMFDCHCFVYKGKENFAKIKIWNLYYETFKDKRHMLHKNENRLTLRRVREGIEASTA